LVVIPYRQRPSIDLLLHGRQLRLTAFLGSLARGLHPIIGSHGRGSATRAGAATARSLRSAHARRETRLRELVLEQQPGRDPVHVISLLGPDKGDPHPGPARAAGAADAVHVAVAIGGGVEVDHVDEQKLSRAFDG
jgi:hypothetical protein